MRTELVFAWFMLFTAISASSSSLNETRIEALDIEQLINEKNRYQDVSQLRIRAFNRKKIPAIRVSPRCDELLIGAFNIKQFGKLKLGRAPEMSVILQIIRRYDVILIQEVMGGIVTDLVNRLNMNSPYRYKAVESRRFGIEQYVFLIRDDSGLLFDENKGRYQFENTKATSFERPPFSIKLRSNCNAMEFVLTAIHTKPDKALDEIDQLIELPSAIRQQLGTGNILIMGDLNAGCDYAPIDELNDLDIRRDNTEYRWLIPDNAKTNVASSRDCPYDRFIMIGRVLQSRWKTGSARVFRYDAEYQLPPNLTANKISDHYPIELKLKNRPPE